VVQRDIAFIVSDKVSADDLERCIRKNGSELLNRIELFDVYQGDKLAANQKSLAYTISLLSREKTLTDSEIEAEISRITLAAERSLGATLRSF
jgi:phenylalanyl-tRNA synthetase beta chain